jgi:isochorismate hydrolase
LGGSVKESYFTLDTIQAAALEMRRNAVAQAGRRALELQPHRSALLVLDMQCYFLDPSSHAFIPSAAAILPGLAGLAAAYRQRDLPVFFTRHENTPEDAGMMSAWWRDLIRPGDALAQITPELDPLDGQVIVKSQYDAFLNTELEQRLHQAGVEQVLVGGVMTHLCCETTARAAFMRGFAVFCLVDGMATYTAAFHQAALLNLAHGFSSLLLVNEACQALRESRL